jgi:hypothetical protein
MVVIPAAKGKIPQTADTASVDTTINCRLVSASHDLHEFDSSGRFVSSIMSY